MNRWLTPLLVSRCRPNRSINLLLQANLAPDDRAVRAWRDWLRIRCLEDATWSEARLLAPLARRIATLDSEFSSSGSARGYGESVLDANSDDHTG